VTNPTDIFGHVRLTNELVLTSADDLKMAMEIENSYLHPR